MENIVYVFFAWLTVTTLVLRFTSRRQARIMSTYFKDVLPLIFRPLRIKQFRNRKRQQDEE
jgi:hypothetical protein